MHTKKVNRQTSFFFALQQFHKLVFARGYGQRRQKEKETNVLETGRHEEKNRDNR